MPASERENYSSYPNQKPLALNTLGGISTPLGGFFDPHEILSRIYGDSAIYLDKVNISEGIGIMEVTPQRANKRDELYLSESTTYEGDNQGWVEILPKHTEGHFTPDSGLPLVLPGHKHIRFAVDCLDQIVGMYANPQLEWERDTYSRLTGFKSVKFLSAIKPGDEVKVNAKLSKKEGFIYTANVAILVNDQISTKIEGLSVEEAIETDEDKILPDQIIEFAAQSAAIGQLMLDPDRKPLFASIGRTRFTGRDITPGMTLVSKAENFVSDGKKFSASSQVTDKYGNLVATIENMSGLIVSGRVLQRALSA